MAEIASVFGILGLIGAFIFPIDNFSYVAASIAANGVKAAKPAQLVVEAHHSTHGVFSSGGKKSTLTLPNLILDHHVHSITLGSGGRIVITYNTQDIDWGYVVVA
ncbi:MAG: hypothetical protein MI756_12310 [Chromatiales bacterium]|nr:hypothetical protein [Chromatiales bacterium]